MAEINLTYIPCQKVYVVELDNKTKKYEIHEHYISHVDICNVHIDSYTCSDGFTDDICISEYWTGLRTCSRRKSPKQNPECIMGDVFLDKQLAKKYLNKMNKGDNLQL